MKCTPNFVITYNRLFALLEKHGGTVEVETFWRAMADVACTELVEKAKQKGLVGLLEYWADTLCAEGADFYIGLDSKGDLQIHIFGCPSHFVMKKNQEPIYEKYCNHCQVMYTEALDEIGYSFSCDSDGKGKCKIEVKKK